jgi:hypothetical protein
MSKGKKSKKDPNEGLPEGFVEAVSSMNTDEIRRKMADILLLDIAMHDVMEQDDKYQRAKEAFEHLAAPYKEDFKSFKKQIAICKRILDDKNGGAISAKLEEDHLAAKEAKRTAGLRESTREKGDDVTTIELSIPGTGKTTGPLTQKAFHEALDKLKNPGAGIKLTGHKPIGSSEIEPIK